MPTNTPLQSIVLTDSTSTITFSNIPQNYTDLVLVGNVFAGSSAFEVRLRLNGDTSSSYSSIWLEGNGTTPTSGREVTTSIPLCYGPGSTVLPTTQITNIVNYSNTTTYKSISTDSASATANVINYQGVWRNTSAINSITLNLTSGRTYYAGTTFDLYGVSPVAANTAQAFGGTDIFYDSTYVYHVFKSSGIFTPYRNLTADILTIAGGGAGGPVYNFSVGGGGGAGGYKLQLAQSLTAINYTCTIGAGGSGGTGPGANGNDSSFGSVSGTIVGGGGGGSNASSGGTRSGANGGSGGGAGGGGVSTFSGGTATSGQGSNGGAYNGSGNEGAGGGGFSAVGSTNVAPNAGRGGNGAGGTGYGDYLVLNSIGAACGVGQLSGGNYYFAGGGSSIGGGQALGGGGLGGGYDTTTFNNPGSAGTTNTGGGGGTWGYAGASGPVTKIGYNGGSGILIVRYAR
jgi:hypothetical protein